MSTREDILSLAVREAIDLLAERKHGHRARSPGHNARLCLESALAAAPTPPAAEAPGQEPVAYLVEHAHSGPVLSWKPPTAGAEAYGWVGTPLFAAPPTYADAEAKASAHESRARQERALAYAAYADGEIGTAGVHHDNAAMHELDAAAIRSLASPAPKEMP